MPGKLSPQEKILMELFGSASPLEGDPLSAVREGEAMRSKGSEGLLEKFGKLLDPSSVVRPGEGRVAQGAVDPSSVVRPGEGVAIEKTRVRALPLDEEAEDFDDEAVALGEDGEIVKPRDPRAKELAMAQLAELFGQLKL